MTDAKTVKKVRTPRTAESIMAGALSLPLADRVKLAKELQGSIAAEVSDLKAKAQEAEKIAGS